MSVSSILSLVFSRRKEEIDAIHDEYHDMLVRMSQGEELDVDEVPRLTVDAGRSQKECDADFELMQKRLKQVEQYRALNQVASTIPALEREAAAAQKKLNDAIEILRPIAQEAERKLRDAQNVNSQVVVLEQLLIQGCLDQSLLARERELEQKRLELVRSRSPLDDDLRRVSSLLRGQTANIENLEISIQKNKRDLPSVAGDKKDLQQARSHHSSLAETVDDLQKAIGDINAELAPIENELAAVRKAKLLP